MAKIEVFNAPGHLCRRPNPARADGLWPGGPFWMVGNDIFFSEDDARCAAEAKDAGRERRG